MLDIIDIDNRRHYANGNGNGNGNENEDGFGENAGPLPVAHLLEFEHATCNMQFYQLLPLLFLFLFLALLWGFLFRTSWSW